MGDRGRVKVIRERFAGDDDFVARFRREVDAARMVTGAFTAPVLDADTGPGCSRRSPRIVANPFFS